ncbi:MAG: transferase [Syntrophomonadaceae bacterium]|nr:transferase [Syntrophomonadaceae bacterium]
MIRIKLSTDFPYEPIKRQTPNSSGRWGDFEFIINQDVSECDYWVVYNDLLRPETTSCPPQNTIFITAEPPGIRGYKTEFIRQFARVITFHQNLNHPRVTMNQPGLNWHAGRVLTDIEQRQSIVNKTYDDFKNMYYFDKSKLLSVVTSSKTHTPGHRKRLELVERLKQHFGDRIDVYGKGVREIEDKWDALADYKYHIALENSYLPHYWTEKLADSYLAGAYPIYYGCPNLRDYFSPNAFTRIDVNNPEVAIATIENCIASNKYENSLEAIRAARNQVLDEYNMFPMIVKLLKKGGRMRISINAGAQVTTLSYNAAGGGARRKITLSPV